MEYEENDDPLDGVAKWPFYLAALFILVLVLSFAYLELQASNKLDTWQLTTCILASGLGSILVFIPHLLDRFLALAFDPANRKDEELHRKTYFDIKEMRSELEALSVKIDKVPTLVDKIVSEAQKEEPESNPVLTQLSTDLDEIKNTLLNKLSSIEELAVQSPLLPEPDPALPQAVQSINSLQESVNSLATQLKELQQTVGKLPREFPKPVVIEKNNLDSANSDQDPIKPDIEDEADLEEENDDVQIDHEEESSISETPDADLSPVSPESSFEQDQDITEESSNEEDSSEDLSEPSISEEQAQDSESSEIMETDDHLNEDEESDIFNSEEIIAESEDHSDQSSDSDQETEDPLEETTSTSEEDEIIAEEQSTIQDGSDEQEFALDLPDPSETLRKVDAILQETDPKNAPSPIKEKKEVPGPKTSQNGTTSVVANVMIGIGNKPYLRGEGPGLSWDEGVPMNFIEIGKWAWSPSRKNASLTVQLYRNDNDPDQTGKIEVKAGEKIEITPSFG